MSKKQAMHLVNPDTKHVELVHGDDVENQKAAGWKEPDGLKSNGEEWNTEDNADQRNAAAEVQKASNERKAKKQADADKEAEKARKAAEKAAEDAPVVQPTPDLRVQIIDPQ